MSVYAPNPLSRQFRDRARELELITNKEELLGIVDRWTKVSDLRHTAGWEILVEMVMDEQQDNINKLIKEVDPRNIAFLQAQIESFRFLLLAPQQADNQLEAARKSLALMEQQTQQYVQSGY